MQSVVRQVAYGTLSRRDRKARHLAAADFLGSQPDPSDDLAVVVAQHLLDAVDLSGSGDTDADELIPRACALLERAGVRAKALGSPGEAWRLYESALARTTDPAEQARLSFMCAETAQDAGDYPGGAELARRAMDLYDELGRPTDAAAAAGVVSLSMQILSDFAGVIALAEPRWQALQGVPGAENAIIRLAGPLAIANFEVGDDAKASGYVEGRVFAAEAIGDPEHLAKSMINLGGRFQGRRGPSVAQAMYEAAAALSRAHDLPGPLAHALVNLGTILMSRDLPAALDTLKEAREKARRAGVSGMIDYSGGNYCAALWSAGRLAESRQVVTETVEVATAPTVRLGLAFLDVFLADAVGDPTPVTPEIDSASSAWDLAARGCIDVMRLMSAGDAPAAAELAEATLAHQLAASGIEDDFMQFWPPLVRAALAAGDVPLAERLLAPAADSAPGLITPAVGAHLLHLRGLVGSLRGDDAATVEADLRAGVAALADFGAVGWSARAEEDLARWLVDQGRAGDAQPHFEHARAAYEQIGAVGWLRTLDASNALLT